MSEKTVIEPVAETDTKVEEYRRAIETKAAIVAAQDEFLQKLADLGLTANKVSDLLMIMRRMVDANNSHYASTVKFSDVLNQELSSDLAMLLGLRGQSLV